MGKYYDRRNEFLNPNDGRIWEAYTNFDQWTDIYAMEIKQCNNICSKCMVFENTCMECSLHRINSPQCTCKSGYLELEQICQTCSLKCIACQNSLEQCTKCSQGIGRNQTLPCNCLQGYYDIPSNIEKNCHQCGHKCISCKDEKNHCLTCRDQNTRTQPPQCQCKSGYYQGEDENCHLCSKKCKSCEQEQNNCKTCKEGQFRTLISPQCGCIDGYYEVENQINCLKCSDKCKTCSNFDTCLICKGDMTNRHEKPTCKCHDGYFEKNYNCHKCGDRCQTCDLEKQNCLSCKQGLQRTGIYPDCSCKIGYYEVQNTNDCSTCNYKCQSCKFQDDNCIICKENRKNPPECNCTKGMVEINKTCISCQLQCLECSQTQENCTICKEGQGRSMKSPKCGCKEGYYDDGTSLDCIQCSYPCFTCIDSPTFCLECGYGLNRQDAPLCSCKPGYSDILNSCTKECHYKCEKCDAQNKSICLECQNDYPYYILIDRDQGTRKCYPYCPENFVSKMLQDGHIDYECKCSLQEGCEDLIDQLDEVVVGIGIGYTNITQNGSVERCSQQGCKQCWGLPASLCEICNVGYYLDKQQICQKCSPECQSCSGPGIENCMFCNSMQTQHISQINSDQCIQISKKEFTDFSQEFENDDLLKYNQQNRRILEQQSQQSLDQEIFYRSVDNRISMQDNYLKTIEMKVKQKHIKCNQSPCTAQYFPVSEKGQQLVLLKLILDLAGIYNSQTNSQYSISSLNQYFYNQDKFIEVKNEARINDIIDFISQWEQDQEQSSNKFYFYSLQNTFKLQQEVWIQFDDKIGLNDDIQTNSFFKNECSAINQQELAQVESEIINIDLDTFYIIQVCDIEKGKIKHGIYLGKSDELENTKFHRMYDINTGQDQEFIFINNLQHPTQVSNIHQLQSYQKVKLYRIPKYKPTINQIVNFDKDNQAKNIRLDQGKEFNQCSLKEVQGLEKQIIDIWNKVNGLQYIDIENDIKSISSQINIQSSLKYVHKDFSQDLLNALKDYSQQNPEIQLKITSLQRTFIGEYILHQHKIRNNRCGITISSGPKYFPSNFIQGKAVQIGSSDVDSKQYGEIFYNVFQGYNMHWLGTIDPTHYNHKYDQINGTDQLWNCANPFEKISQDGSWGPQTEQKIQQSPSDGFDVQFENCNFTNFEENINYKVVKIITQRALKKSKGKCAKYVRQSLQMARGLPDQPAGIESAKDFGPFLEQLGYKQTNKKYYQATLGDVGIIQSSGKHIHGHIAVKIQNGKWASDFIQNYFRIWGDVELPPYIIYSLE